MNTLHKVLLYAMVSVIAGFALTIVAPPVYAQGGGTYCASNDNRFARCQVSWRDAILVQQSSKAACIRGKTWGFDRNGIWVNGGCRGQFAPARGGWEVVVADVSHSGFAAKAAVTIIGCAR